MYQVHWLQTALNELAAAWTPASSSLRQAITLAARDIDQALQRDPENEGESRPDDQRVMFAPPLGVAFRVDPQQRRVYVLHVWVIRRRGQP